MDEAEQKSVNILTALDSRQPRKLVCLSGEYEAICAELLALLTAQQKSHPHQNEKTDKLNEPPFTKPLYWVGSMPSSEYRLSLAKRRGSDSDLGELDLFVPEQAAVVQHLGTEHALIVFDAREHFDANAFAAICGTLIHSGRLYLLMPAHNLWGQKPDPISGSDLSAPLTPGSTTARFEQGHGAKDLNRLADNRHQQGYFLKRFTHLLRECTQALPVQTDKARKNSLEHRELIVAPGVQMHSQAADHTIANDATNTEHPPDSPTAAAAQSSPNSRFPLTADQQHLMQKLLLETATLNEHIWLITADRGRGKSALLGMLLAELAGKSKRRSGSDKERSGNNPSGNLCNGELLISGPSKRATKVLLRHFRNACDLSPGTTESLKFYPPDDLLTTNLTPALLVVDEAAAIPLPMLKKLLQKFPRVILSTTVHGYEGAGRGFEIRMGQWMQQQHLAHQWLYLSQPVRWLPADRLEHFCNQAFLLNAKIPELPSSPGSEPCHVRELSSTDLIDNESLLIAVFALLVQAHYQTKPVDLQHLLDGENLRIFVLQSSHYVIGVAWLAAEGPFNNNSLQTAIVRNQRRPHGHLLPQLLSQWTGRQQVLDYRLSRVVRLAIHPDLQRQGFGSLFIRHLIDALDKESTQTRFTGIGALFAAEPGIVEFWKKSGFQPFHLGAKQNRRSGLRSIAMLRPLGATDLNHLLDYAVFLYRVNYRRDLQTVPAYQPSQPAKRAGSDQDPALLDSDRLVQDYINGYRSFENSREFIRLQVKKALKSDQFESLNDGEKDLLYSSLESGFSFAAYAYNTQLQGKKQAESLYRSILKKVLSD